MAVAPTHQHGRRGVWNLGQFWVGGVDKVDLGLIFLGKENIKTRLCYRHRRLCVARHRFVKKYGRDGVAPYSVVLCLAQENSPVWLVLGQVGGDTPHQQVQQADDVRVHVCIRGVRVEAENSVAVFWPVLVVTVETGTGVRVLPRRVALFRCEAGPERHTKFFGHGMHSLVVVRHGVKQRGLGTWFALEEPHAVQVAVVRLGHELGANGLGEGDKSLGVCPIVHVAVDWQRAWPVDPVPLKHIQLFRRRGDVDDVFQIKLNLLERDIFRSVG